MAKKKSSKTERGKITRAGQLLSQFIRDIALEKTELVKVDGEDRIASKAEALARLMWQRALGYTEIKIPVSGPPENIIHPPDKMLMGMIFDRSEGRAPLMNPEKGNKRTIADKVSEQGKKRIAKIGGISEKTV